MTKLKHVQRSFGTFWSRLSSNPKRTPKPIAKKYSANCCCSNTVLFYMARKRNCRAWDLKRSSKSQNICLLRTAVTKTIISRLNIQRLCKPYISPIIIRLHDFNELDETYQKKTFFGTKLGLWMGRSSNLMIYMVYRITGMI